MFLELIATFVVGVAATGVILFLNKITGGRLPKWAMPVVAGGAMIGFTIYSEYTWYGRTKTTLPDGIEVVSTVESKAMYRPWTYLKPYVSRFAALDRSNVMTNDAAPDQRIVSFYFMGRWSPARQVRMLFDCGTGRRVDLVDGLDLGADGLPTAQAVWIAMDEDSPLLTSVCQGEETWQKQQS